MASAEPAIPPFPSFARAKVVMPIDGDKLTLWPQKREKWWEKVLGFPFELRFFAKDYLWISSNGNRIEIQPHYLESTFDTFWIDTRGAVAAQALGGLFPFTLGKQKQLLKGIVATLAAMPSRLKPKDDAVAGMIREIHAQLAKRSEPEATGGARAPLGRLRSAASNWVWERKLRNWKPPAP